MHDALNHLSLFTGIGGLDLAAESAGFRTVGQCEWADFPTKVLEMHWPDVPRWRDIRTLTRESFYERTGLRTVDVISGGFPCQPFSVAGKRRGSEDDRYLWPEMLRVIKEIRPAWVVGENVAGIVNMELDTVLSDLESQGYETRAFVFPACAVDAPHRRDRCAIVAYADRKRREKLKSSAVADQTESAYRADLAGDVSDPNRQVRNRCITYKNASGNPRSADSTWWQVEPNVGRVVDGVPHRVDRLKCLGNAVVPAQFYPVFRAIAEVEGSEWI